MQGSFTQLADGSVFKLGFESGKITLSPTNEQLLLPSSQESEAISCGKTVQLQSRESKSLISEVTSPAKSFYFLNKYTLLGCWQESQKLFLSPLRLLARCSQSNVSNAFIRLLFSPPSFFKSLQFFRSFCGQKSKCLFIVHLFTFLGLNCKDLN